MSVSVSTSDRNYFMRNAVSRKGNNFKKLAIDRLCDGMLEIEVESLKYAMRTGKETVSNSCVFLSFLPKDKRVQISRVKWYPHVLYFHLFRNPELESWQKFWLTGNCVNSFDKEKTAVCVQLWHYSVLFLELRNITKSVFNSFRST